MNNFALGYSYEKSLENDYGFAIIHLLWYIHKDHGRNLVFGMVECYPAEFTFSSEINEQDGKFKDGCRLYYIRIKKTIRDALEWYKSCRTNVFITMDWDKDKAGKSKVIHCGEMLEMPQWPNFVLSNINSDQRAPFIAEEWGTARIHHLFPKIHKEYLVNFINHANTGKWINERLLWDINQFEELIGSLHLVLPNPLYRSMSQRLIPGANGEVDRVKVHFTPRQGKVLSGIEMLSAERLHFGIAGGHITQVNENNFSLQLAGKSEEFASIVRCPERGILEYTSFGSFIRGFNIKMHIANAKKIVTIPDSQESYMVPMFESVDSIISEENDSSELELGRKLGNVRALRNRKDLANRFGQKLFCQNPKEAEEFIRELIGKARKRVIIIDPYFSTIELFKFAFAVTSGEVNLQIITSALVLREKSRLPVYNEKKTSTPEKGEEFFEQIRSSDKISVGVMTGDQPLIHDRFLIVDDEVWLSGNSLHTLGERASMIIRVPDPEEILDLIEKTISNKDQVKNINEWVENRSNTRKEEVDNHVRDERWIKRKTKSLLKWIQNLRGKFHHPN